jgi:hypothetical protein
MTREELLVEVVASEATGRPTIEPRLADVVRVRTGGGARA